MTDDERTVLMIAARGESMIPIGRWEKPIKSLTAMGLMRRINDENYVITDAGRSASQEAEDMSDAAFIEAIRKG